MLSIVSYSLEVYCCVVCHLNFDNYSHTDSMIAIDNITTAMLNLMNKNDQRYPLGRNTRELANLYFIWKI